MANSPYDLSLGPAAREIRRRELEMEFKDTTPRTDCSLYDLSAISGVRRDYNYRRAAYVGERLKKEFGR